MPKWYGLQGLIIIIIKWPGGYAAFIVVPLTCCCVWCVEDCVYSLRSFMVISFASVTQFSGQHI
jgi:hypothetical protein